MLPKMTNLLASSHPVLTGMFYAALGLYTLSWLVTLIRPRYGRVPLVAAVLLHLLMTVGRGSVIGFFPLTNKMESFSAAALALGLVATVAWHPVRRYSLVMVGLCIAALTVASSFRLDLRYPPPLMRTIWYPLHVPLSFLAYALWAAAATAALAWWRDRNPTWLARLDRYALYGFGLWSVSMICGGIWGVVAWGAYFMWDPKIIWSVMLWFHYASFLHVRLTPSLRGHLWVRPTLAVVGYVWVFVAYVGTSFFFGKSSHAF
jgi:ABC-type uncharacterized transport system permease subunit